jgi:hypothetical protein
MKQASRYGVELGFPTAPSVRSIPVDLTTGQRPWYRSAAKMQTFVRYRAVFALVGLLIVFGELQVLLPLSTAVKIGADEDYELSKATLCNHGYNLYTQIWNDQPPLVTFIIANLIRAVPHSILAPRLLTVGFTMVLLAATFTLIRAVSGTLAASVATVMLIGSPGFLELSASVMQEIPALAPVIAAMCVLLIGRHSKWQVTELLAGLVFGFALQMKLIGAAYLPIAGLILWFRSKPLLYYGVATQLSCGTNDGRARRLSKGTFAFGTSMFVTFIALNYLTGNSLLLQLHQSWAAHFATAKSFEYGSPQEHGYDWSVPLKNWETTVPALLGLWVLASRLRRRWEVLPVFWLILTFVVFGRHKPWWAYYYIHNALPLCWCAGVGIAFLWEELRSRYTQSLSSDSAPPNEGKRSPYRLRSQRPFHAGRIRWQAAALLLLGLCAAGWMGARLYLEEQAIRSAPQLYTCLVLKEIERFKPFTKFMFSDQPIYSFHADLPMPPHLAVLSLKRLWTGELDNAGIRAELETLKPGLILLGKESREVPYEELLNREYRLVYQDSANRLYAHETISKKPSL